MHVYVPPGCAGPGCSRSHARVGCGGLGAVRGVVGLIPAPVPGVTVSRPESARMETGASWRGPGPSGRPALWGLRPPGIPPVVFPPWGGRRPSAASSVLSRKTGAERREPWQTDGLSVFRLQPPGVS